jgi:hypothetical protein
MPEPDNPSLLHRVGERFEIAWRAGGAAAHRGLCR